MFPFRLQTCSTLLTVTCIQHTSLMMLVLCSPYHWMPSTTELMSPAAVYLSINPTSTCRLWIYLTCGENLLLFLPTSSCDEVRVKNDKWTIDHFPAVSQNDVYVFNEISPLIKVFWVCFSSIILMMAFQFLRNCIHTRIFCT